MSSSNSVEINKIVSPPPVIDLKSKKSLKDMKIVISYLCYPKNN